jgi:hypothetical protein
MLLPPGLEQDVAGDNPVPGMAACVDQLDPAALGWTNTVGTLDARRSSDDPADHLERCLYGPLNRVSSTRRLAANCRRNPEVFRLSGGLAQV